MKKELESILNVKYRGKYFHEDELEDIQEEIKKTARRYNTEVDVNFTKRSDKNYTIISISQVSPKIVKVKRTKASPDMIYTIHEEKLPTSFKEITKEMITAIKEMISENKTRKNKIEDIAFKEEVKSYMNDIYPVKEESNKSSFHSEMKALLDEYLGNDPWIDVLMDKMYKIIYKYFMVK